MSTSPTSRVTAGVHRQLEAPAPGASRGGPGERLLQLDARTVFVRVTDWRTGTRLEPAETALLMRRLRARDFCLLNLLAQHLCLSTDQVESLLFPSRRSAQIRLRWLVEAKLLVLWHQLQPVVGGWRRRPSVYQLTERGAVVLATNLKVDPRPLIRRSWYAAEYCLHMQHDLEVNGFFIRLAAATVPLTDAGLYHWVGDDSMHRAFQERGEELSPDGWGRLVTADREVTFMLEWDRGTEASRRIVAKAAAYASYYAGHPPESDQLLFVAARRAREDALRIAIGRGARAAGQARFWTSSAALIEEKSALGEVWQCVGDNSGARRRLADLPGQPRTGRAASDAVGKPGWWNERPAAGEGD